MKTSKVLTEKEILHIAELANLRLTENEVTRFRKQLSKVIEYISKLNEVNTQKIEPTGQTTGIINVFREDKPDNSRLLSQKNALKNAKSRKNNFFKVKAIFE